MKGLSPHRAALLIGALALLLPAGCASRDMVVEIHGAVMYDKPEIEAVSHVLEDRRPAGGVVVLVTLQGDPGLAATFDISPDIVDRVSMQEVEAGTYTGRFAFPANPGGGPYTVLGRLRHEDAGEVVLRDQEPITISLTDRAR